MGHAEPAAGGVGICNIAMLLLQSTSLPILHLREVHFFPIPICNGFLLKWLDRFLEVVIESRANLCHVFWPARLNFA